MSLALLALKILGRTGWALKILAVAPGAAAGGAPGAAAAGGAPGPTTEAGAGAPSETGTKALCRGSADPPNHGPPGLDEPPGPRGALMTLLERGFHLP